MTFVRILGRATAFAAALAVSLLAATAQGAACSLTHASPSALACAGFYDASLRAGSPAALAAQQASLGMIGLTGNGDFGAADRIDSLAGASTVDFATLLHGIGRIGTRAGAGTAFFRLDEPREPDDANPRQAAATAALPSATPTVASVPESTSYALLLTGLAGVALFTRRHGARR